MKTETRITEETFCVKWTGHGMAGFVPAENRIDAELKAHDIRATGECTTRIIRTIREI